MEEKKLICIVCGKEHDGSYGSGKFCSQHCKSVYASKQTKHHVTNFKTNKAPYGKWTCKFCKLICETKKELWIHYHQEHESSLYGAHGKGKTAWNKGLTKENNSIISARAKKLSEKYKKGELIPSFKGCHHSEEAKRRIGDGNRKKKFRRIMRHTKEYHGILYDSSWEIKMAKRLEEIKEPFIRPEPIEYFDDNQKKHFYFPDFFLPKRNKYIEIKNQFLFQNDKKVQILKKRPDIIWITSLKQIKDFI